MMGDDEIPPFFVAGDRYYNGFTVREVSSLPHDDLSSFDPIIGVTSEQIAAAKAEVDAATSNGRSIMDECFRDYLLARPAQAEINGVSSPWFLEEVTAERQADADLEWQSLRTFGAEMQPLLRPLMTEGPDPNRCDVSGALLPTRYWECWAAPEIVVTDEMTDAAVVAYKAWIAQADPGSFVRDASALIYRAMAAVAPVDLYRADERRIDALTEQRNAWTQIAMRQRVRITAIEAEQAVLRAQLAALTGADPKPADLPDPPRRPDGTLIPQAKPWSPPKPVGDTRRIGG
jgi:hypothetical protein